MKRIPTVLSADELLDKAFRRGSKTPGRKGVPLAAAKTKLVATVIDSTLSKYVKAFPSMDRLHPFHRELIDVLVGVDRLRHSIGALDWCRKQVSKIAKENKYARDPSQPYGRISSVVKRVRKELDFAAEAARMLNRIPEIDPEQPCVIVAGPPNVGKSQLVGALSSAKPAIAPYPFTTKGIHVGHTDFKYNRVQVIDTPGLLDRPLEERNDIERQAMLALRHLKGVVVYTFDPTETCGYDMEYQERVKAGLGAIFEGKAVIEIENKADMPGGRPKRTRVSALKGAGIPELREEIRKALGF
ncbi:MAG: 50S ribosome-binding GTPase [Euryarchaeota archaeon]|nr:50S ribosome-binding GTPase [Euryarchaeota archaeon]